MNTTRLIFLSFIVSVGFWECRNRTPKVDANAAAWDRLSKRIVLVNAVNKDRCELAEIVAKISSSGCTVIGINYVFDGSKGVACDSLLGKAISAGKVVLVDELDGTKCTRSNFFTDVARGSGPVGLSYDEDDFLNHYYKTVALDCKESLSFPYLVSIFGVENADQLKVSNSLKQVKIPDDMMQVSFRIVAANAVQSGDATIFQDKIVLIGDLGDSKSDTENFKAATQEHATVILGWSIVSMMAEAGL